MENLPINNPYFVSPAIVSMILICGLGYIAFHIGVLKSKFQRLDEGVSDLKEDVEKLKSEFKSVRDDLKIIKSILTKVS